MAASIATPPHWRTRPRSPKKVGQAFTVDEMRRLIEAFRGTAVEPLALTAFGTGARQGELLVLRWEDIDGATMTIRRTMQEGGTASSPKTESSIRDLTMPQFVVNALRAHRQRQRNQRLAAGAEWQDNDLVFARKDGRSLPVTTVRQQLRAVLDAAALPRRPFHALRHAYATMLRESGEDIGTISKLLGHASIATTMNVYSHLSSKTTRRVAAELDAIVNGLGVGKG